MNCKACATAITGGAEYRNGCRGCAARALAGHPDAQIAFDRTAPRQERIEAWSRLEPEVRRLLPNVQRSDATEAIDSWVKVIRANNETRKA